MKYQAGNENISKWYIRQRNIWDINHDISGMGLINFWCKSINNLANMHEGRQKEILLLL